MNAQINTINEAPPSRNESIAHCLVEHLFKNVSTAVIGTALVAALTTYVVSTQFDPRLVFGWLVVTLALAGARALLARRYFTTAPGASASQWWRRQYLMLLLGSAFCWGLAGAFLLPINNGVEQALFFVLLSGVAAISVQTLMADRLAATFVIVLTLAPLCIRLLVLADSTSHIVASLMVLIFSLLLIRAAWQSYAMLRSTITMGIETRQLIDQSEGLICTHNLYGRVLSVNPAAIAAVGLSEKEIIGHRLDEVMTQFGRDEMPAYLKRITERGFDEGQMYLVMRNGERRTWRYKNRLYTPLEGAPFIIGHAQDVTDSVQSAQMLRETIELLPAEFSRFDADSRLVLMNSRFAKIADGIELGMTYEEILRLQLDQGLISEAIGREEEWLAQRLAEGMASKSNYAADRQRANGHWISINERRNPDGSTVRIGTDITARKNLEANLRVAERGLEERVELRTAELLSSEARLIRSEARFKDYAETAADYYWETDPDFHYTHIAGRFEELTGIAVNAALGHTLLGISAEWANGPHEPNPELLEALRDKSPFDNIEFRWRHSDHLTRIFQLSGKPIFGKHFEILGYRGSGRDVTEVAALSRQLKFDSTHDSLTGLTCRREFERRLNGLLQSARTNGVEHTLGFVDLDRFKDINDSCGHIAGDELLRQLTSLFQMHVFEPNTLARIGGNEFGILFECCDVAQAQAIIDGLQEEVERFRFLWGDEQYAVGTGVGLVPINATSGNIVNVMQAVDSACYTAKSQGRNRVVVQQASDSVVLERRDEIRRVAQINWALDNDQFELMTQTIVATSHHAPTGTHYEVLLGMRDDDTNIMPAGFLLPLAERCGLATEIDRWVVSTSLKWWADNPELLENLQLCSINLSGKTLSDAGFGDYVISEIRKRNIPARKLCFEVTETAAISNWQQAVTLIEQLRNFGCRIALDDFGSGLSSYAYLKKLPLDYIKIDGIFVKDIDTNPISYAMVKSIHEIAHIMGIQTIAECVENQAVVRKLQQIGIDYLQGYFVGRPQSIDRVVERPDADRDHNVVNIVESRS